MLIRFNFFISPGSLSKTGFFLHLRTEVPEDHQGTEVAPGQWRRAAGMGWAGLMALCCRRDQLQEQWVNPTGFPPSPPIFLSLSGFGVRSGDTGWRGRGGSRFAGLMPRCSAPLLGHWCPAGRSRSCLLPPDFPTFGSAGHQKHAKVFCAPTLIIYLSVAKMWIFIASLSGWSPPSTELEG